MDGSVNTYKSLEDSGIKVLAIERSLTKSSIPPLFQTFLPTPADLGETAEQTRCGSAGTTYCHLST